MEAAKNIFILSIFFLIYCLFITNGWRGEMERKQPVVFLKAYLICAIASGLMVLGLFSLDLNGSLTLFLFYSLVISSVSSAILLLACRVLHGAVDFSKTVQQYLKLILILFAINLISLGLFRTVFPCMLKNLK
jgi:hypothetical protein